jgi:hypothetical protein
MSDQRLKALAEREHWKEEWAKADAEVKRLRGGIERALAVIIGMKVNRPVQNILEELIE